MLITFQMITMYWLFLLPLVGSVQSGLLPMRSLGTPAQICAALVCPGIPFACLFLLFIGMGLLMVSTQDPALAPMAISGYALTGVAGLVVGGLFLLGVITGLKAIWGATVGRFLEMAD